MMKRSFFALIFIFLSGWNLLAQYPVVPPYQSQPVNPEQNVERSMNNLPMISEPRSVMESAMGWTLLDNGKWVSVENRLLYSSAEYYKSNKAYYKLGKENFDILELRDVSFENEQYAVLIMKFRTGYYEFPILMETWHNQTGLSYFVFKMSKLQDLFPEKMEFNKPYITNMEVVCSGTLIDYDKNTFSSTIAFDIQKTLSDKTIASHNLLIAFWPVQTGGQTLARFRLIKVMNKKKFYTPYLELKNRDKLFRASYYETDYNAFQSFFRISGGMMPMQQFTGTPQSADDYYRRGISNYNTGNFAQAVYDLTEAAKYQPYSDFFLTYAYRANARQKMNDFTGAMQDFDRAVMLKPADQGYYSSWLTTIYNRGVARFNLKDNNGACQDWNTAVQFGFKDLETDKAIREYCKNYHYTGPSAGIGMTSSATPGSYYTTPATQNDYFKVYWDGVWKYENGNYAEAIRSFNRSIELKPQSVNIAGIYAYRGNCKLKLSDYSGAILDFDYALGLSTTKVTDNTLLKSIYYNRGLANFFLGNTSIACSDFQKSLNAGMSDPQSVGFIRQVCK